MKRSGSRLVQVAAVLCLGVWALAPVATAQTNATPGAARTAENPYLDNWALTLPGGWAAWLGVEDNEGQLTASLVWFDGTFGPAAASLEGGKLLLTRKRLGKLPEETITATVDGDALKLEEVTPNENDRGETKFTFTGQRLPPVPPVPDLAKVKFGDPIQLVL